ncbi:hypothetical protein Hdeb2414_s0007g00228091 [Helianthus debilis subsp. tardiflorus]
MEMTSSKKHGLSVLTFLLLASCQLLYAIYTYRDYETLNYQMLQSLVKKVNRLQGNKQFLCEDDDSDVDWTSWIDSDLPEDELDEIDYMLPEEVRADSSVSREYNLCRRRQ